MVLLIGFPLALLYLSNITSTEFPSIGPDLMVSALAFHVAAIGLLILIWKGMLWQGAKVQIAMLEGLAHISQTLMGKYLPGKLWGLFSRGVMVSKKFSNVTDNVVVSVVEQLTLMHAAAVCCVMFGAVYYAIQNGPWWISVLASLIIMISVYVMAFGLVHVKELSVRVLRFFKVSAVKSSDVWDNLAGRHYVANVLLFSLYWILLAAIVVALFWSWFYHGAFDDAFYARLVLVFAAVPAGVVAGFLVLWVPSGIGVREGVIVGILGLQFSVDQAVMMSVVYRIWCVFADFIIGFCGVFLARRYA